MPIVWIAHLIGAPIKNRVSGSDIFEALKQRSEVGQRLKVFFFGGADGVAEAAAQALDATVSGITSAGTLAPGFGSIEAMGCDEIIDEINVSKADFLAVSLGARKGQLWLHRNHRRLRIPIRVHLGATINFQAGSVKRAPSNIRKWGLEWLWRIKEEPHLWRRYGHDGWVLFRLVFSRIVPLTIINRWNNFKCERHPKELLITVAQNQDSATIRLSGDATVQYVDKAIACFQERLINGIRTVAVDLSRTRVIDGRFFGLLLMLRKRLKGQGATLKFVGAAPRIRRLFRLNEVGFLLNEERIVFAAFN
jgi:N-acetylglucosaminyldiphosphoundecaprenol N-acetyl-beta-D-mannosaminyltransferase